MLKKIVLVTFTTLLIGYIFSLVTKSNSEKYFNYDVRITVLPFVQQYNVTLDGISEPVKGVRPINDCPSTTLIEKGILFPIVHVKVSYARQYIGYKGPCL